jgi:hypothetical protein
MSNNEAELEKPYDTLTEIVDYLEKKDQLLAATIADRMDEIVWSPVAYAEIEKTLPKKMQVKFKTIHQYIHDANKESFDVLFNVNSPLFNGAIALIIANRIWDMPTGAEKQSAIEAFTNRVLHMASDDVDITEMADILYNVRISPNERVNLIPVEDSTSTDSALESDESSSPPPKKKANKK